MTSRLLRTILQHHKPRKQYVDRIAATAGLRAHHGDTGGSVYRCEVCGCWHVVSPRKIGGRV